MKPTNNLVNPLLTDLYQLTMAYAYWKAGRHEDDAVFDLFFRKNPFGGEFTIFAGLEEALNFVENFRFTERDIRYLREGYVVSKEELQAEFESGLRGEWIRKTGTGYEQLYFGPWGAEYWRKVEYPTQDVYVDPPMKNCQPEFFDWLRTLDCSQAKIHAVKEGTIVFPKVPLMRVEGPLAAVQLLETTLLNLVNYASLVATNAARFRLAAGFEKTLIEFGLRRAQGPDGAVSASLYTYIGGFDATSNVLAGQLFGIPVRGTHAHAFVSSFAGLDDLRDRTIVDAKGNRQDFLAAVLQARQELGYVSANEGELAAFIAYAQAFPNGFLALVDTYDTLESGVPNFLCVAVALYRFGYKPVGIRLDSGDLAYLSKGARRMFREAGGRCGIDFSFLKITASNDINEEILYSLKQQGHEIDVFGIGTHLVTCQAQPALGCIYKLVEVRGQPRIKLSQEMGKVTIPGRKEAYRLVGSDGFPILDLLVPVGTAAPESGRQVLCRHPFDEIKRVYVRPTVVLPLHYCVWNRGRRGSSVSRQEVREYVMRQLKEMRPDHLRPINPTPYKVSVSEELYQFLHGLMGKEAPIKEIR